MECIKGVPYFCAGEKIKEYPYLNKDVSCDVLIIGGGIVGAIANYYISKVYNTVLVDKSRFGGSLTSCATVLLEYQLDIYADELTKYLSEEDIVSAYRMGLDGIKMIEKFIKKTWKSL